MSEIMPGHHVAIINLDDDEALDTYGRVTSMEIERGVGGWISSARVTIELDREP